MEKLELDLRREKVNAETLRGEKSSLESKIAALREKQTNDMSEEIAQLKLKV